MTDDPVELTRTLIRIDSRSPGNLDATPTPGRTTEADIAGFVAARLEAVGFETELQPAAPGRPNLVAGRTVDPAAPFLFFEAHFDTVGTEGMTVPPFDPQLRDGRLYGRGACDTKGSMAAMLTALQRLAGEKLPLNLGFIGSCAEETGCEGVRRLNLNRFRAPLAVVVGEPTENRPVTGHKAHAWCEWLTRGRAAHGSNPAHGDNAVYRMARVVTALEAYAAGPLQAVVPPPGFSAPTLSVGTIRGGTKENIVPDHCAIQIDFRLLPEQPLDAFLADLHRYVLEKTGEPVETAWMRFSEGFAAQPDSPLLNALNAAAARIAGSQPAATETVNYCTDAGPLAAAGHHPVVFGPGSIRQAHSADEWIEVRQIREAVEILCAAARQLAATGTMHA